MSRHRSPVFILAGGLIEPMVKHLLTASCCLPVSLPLLLPGVEPARASGALQAACRHGAAAGAPCIGLLTLAEMNSAAQPLHP